MRMKSAATASGEREAAGFPVRKGSTMILYPPVSSPSAACPYHVNFVAIRTSFYGFSILIIPNKYRQNHCKNQLLLATWVKKPIIYQNLLYGGFMKPTLRQRLRYYFDNLMSRGTPALIGMLFLLSLTVIVLATVIIAGFGLHQAESTDNLSFGEAFWESLMRTLDPGTMGSDTGTGFRLIMFFVTIGGIFVVSTLIGVLSNGIEEQMNRLRKGRSIVLESDHTLVLGWSPQVFTILNELMTANENQSRA